MSCGSGLCLRASIRLFLRWRGAWCAAAERATTMTNLSSAGALAARVLLAFMFILAGWGKLGDIPGTMAYTASGGLPGFFVFPAIAIELLGGLAVLVGWQTRWAALALARLRRRGRDLLPLPPGAGPRGLSSAWARSSTSRRTSPSPAASSLLAAFGAGRYSLDARTAGGSPRRDAPCRRCSRRTGRGGASPFRFAGQATEQRAENDERGPDQRPGQRIGPARRPCAARAAGAGCWRGRARPRRAAAAAGRSG